MKFSEKLWGTGRASRCAAAISALSIGASGFGAVVFRLIASSTTDKAGV